MLVLLVLIHLLVQAAGRKDTQEIREGKGLLKGGQTTKMPLWTPSQYGIVVQEPFESAQWRQVPPTRC